MKKWIVIAAFISLLTGCSQFGSQSQIVVQNADIQTAIDIADAIALDVERGQSNACERQLLDNGILYKCISSKGSIVSFSAHRSLVDSGEITWGITETPGGFWMRLNESMAIRNLSDTYLEIERQILNSYESNNIVSAVREIAGVGSFQIRERMN